MFRLLLSLAVAYHLLLCYPQDLPAAEIIGTVKTFRGEVTVERAGGVSPAVLGMPLYQNDTLKTGEHAAIGIILRDDTVISMGPGSVLSLQEYLFQPQEDRYSIILKLLKGTFVYLSGVIGKLSPESIRVETPDSTIAVRGTRLLIKVN